MTKKPSRTLPTDISSFTLHLLAMGFMLCDHLWATVVPGNQWLTMVGRLAFPIFAFFIAEGYFHTSSFKKYLLRIFLFALLSEIPFNLMYTASWVYPFQQNVMWTFLLSLLCIHRMEKLRQRHKSWLALPLCALLAAVFMLLAQFTFVDYSSYGLLTVVLFYFLRGNRWYHRLGQLAGLIYINFFMISGLNIPLELFGVTWELPLQGCAVLSLLFIWCYRGRQGPHNRLIQYAFYAFYPAHMLLLGLLSM